MRTSFGHVFNQCVAVKAGLLGTVLVLVAACTPSAVGADYFLDKVASTPDYYQTDPSYGGFPDGGGYYCGPVAASNGVMWLANNGYSNLALSTPNQKYNQHWVAEALGSDAFMETESHGGTNPTRVAHGLAEFINDRGYEYTQMEFRSWRSITEGDRIDKTSNYINLDWAKEGIESPYSMELWSVGWYDYDADLNSYTRVGGHWVAMVGYGRGSDNPTDLDPDCLIIHDPAPRTGKTFKNDYVDTELLTSGTIKSGGFTTWANGYYRISGWTTKKPYAILDGVLVIDMAAPGDANLDGKVDGADVTILANNWQTGVDGTIEATWSMGDFNTDGKVDGSDVTILANHWQEGTVSAASAVPEPGLLGLSLTGVLALAGIGFRRKIWGRPA